jgi:hypothetical protein
VALLVGLSQHPISTARSVRSSSQSINNSAKVRVFGLPEDLPIGALEVPEHQDVEELGASSRGKGLQALAERLSISEGTARTLVRVGDLLQPRGWVYTSHLRLRSKGREEPRCQTRTGPTPTQRDSHHSA